MIAVPALLASLPATRGCGSMSSKIDKCHLSPARAVLRDVLEAFPLSPHTRIELTENNSKAWPARGTLPSRKE